MAFGVGTLVSKISGGTQRLISLVWYRGVDKELATRSLAARAIMVVLSQ